MADTYTQLHIHIVFSVKFRKALLDKIWRDELYRYITGIIQNRQHKLVAIGGTADHVHILIGMRPHDALSDLMRVVKSDSSMWIMKKRFVHSNFRWQAGYGAFGVNNNGVNTVVDYILRQEQHHARQTFDKEYVQLLRQNSIDYKQEYLFHEPI